MAIIKKYKVKTYEQRRSLKVEYEEFSKACEAEQKEEDDRYWT